MRKDETHKLIDRMPAGPTRDDLVREIYVRETAIAIRTSHNSWNSAYYFQN
jgi:hypothetical protein